jgi:hypothetical protein
MHVYSSKPAKVTVFCDDERGINTSLDVPGVFTGNNFLIPQRRKVHKV